MRVNKTPLFILNSINIDKQIIDCSAIDSIVELVEVEIIKDTKIDESRRDVFPNGRDGDTISE